MKKLALIFNAIVSLSGSVGQARTETVRAYVSKSGKYVSAHQRSTPNKSAIDNWSQKGNVNPYTGKAGKRTKRSLKRQEPSLAFDF